MLVLSRVAVHGHLIVAIHIEGGAYCERCDPGSRSTCEREQESAGGVCVPWIEVFNFKG